MTKLIDRATSTSRALTHPHYRSDIDGLRAVAVLSVLGFHAFPEWVHGGFIGVDIFFVISGFLISTIIFQSLAAGRFSFVDFYSSRVRRIFPALATVLLSTLVVGWFVLYPDEYRQLGKHVLGGAGFISNFVLWRESGYFDSAAEVKPLLHLWSLGIEEQFYILFPLLVWLAWKRRLNLLTLVLFIGVMSYVLNLEHVRKDSAWTFYQPQTRFWELMIGSVLALLVLDKSGLITRAESWILPIIGRVIYRDPTQEEAALALANIKAWLGVFFITVALLCISRESVFPGSWALAPTLGAASLIWAGPQALVNRKLLAHPLMVWVGKISYPLYLWHWVILVFLRILASETPSIQIRCAGLVLAFILSWIINRYIETPVRFGENSYHKTLPLLLIMLTVACIGGASYRLNGFVNLRPALGITSAEQFAWPFLSNTECLVKVKSQPGFCIQLGNSDRITMGVIGDSTANALVPGIELLVKARGEGMINIGHGACPPVRGLVPTETWGAKPNCPEIVEEAYRVVLSDPTIKTIIMSIFTHDMQYWGFKDLPQSATPYERFAKSAQMLDSDISALNASGKKVILTYDAAFSPISAKDCVHRPYSQWLRKEHNCVVTEDKIIDRQPYLTLFNEHFQGRRDICVFHQSELLFTGGKLNLVDNNGKAILRDSHHLSVEGSRRMAEYLLTSNCREHLPWGPIQKD